MTQTARDEVLVIAGGGTGGHIYPGIAVAQELCRRREDRRIVFIGTERGIEARAVPKAGFELECLQMSGLVGKGWRDKLRGLVQVATAFVGALRSLRRLDARLVLGVGGYASGPAVAAGVALRLPCVIQEQNVFPGITNRLLAYAADAVALPFEESRRHLAGGGTVTGNPVRDGFSATPLPDSDDGWTVLVFGGSQGARALNEALTDALPHLGELRGRLRFEHQTGRSGLEELRRAYADHGIEAEVEPFFDDMPERYQRATLVVARSGASTVAELAAAGRPSVLVPFPHASHNHQEYNARLLEDAGAAIVHLENELDGPTLARTLVGLLQDPGRLDSMAQAAARRGHPDATARVADLVESLLATHERRRVS